MQIPHVFQIISLCEEGKGKKKKQAAPVHRQRDSLDREYSGNKGALCVKGELTEIWLFVAQDHLCASPTPPVGSHAVFQESGSEQKHFEGEARASEDTGEASSPSPLDELLAHLACTKAQAVTSVMGIKGGELVHFSEPLRGL